MKLRTTTEYRDEPREITVGGKVHTTTRRVPVQIPQVPRDWDQIAVRAVICVVMGLTAVAVVWSTYSIGALLHGGVGYAAAAVFDAAWLVNVLLEYLGRFDQEKRARNKWLGWSLLIATMGAIFWHGWLAGSVALGVVGAAVSLFAKVLWLSIMTHVNKGLSEDHQEWVALEMSEANAKMALAQVRRQSARVEAGAALELLAAERIRGQYAALTPASVPQAMAAPVNVADEAPSRDQFTLRRAARALLTDDAAAPDKEESEETAAAIEAARADGWRTREIYDTAMSIRRTSPRTKASERPADIRPETVSAQASEADARGYTRPVSVRAGVSELYRAGITDPHTVAARLSRIFGPQVSADTVGRYLRDLKATPPQTADGIGRGGGGYA